MFRVGLLSNVKLVVVVFLLVSEYILFYRCPSLIRMLVHDTLCVLFKPMLTGYPLEGFSLPTLARVYGDTVKAQGGNKTP